VVKNISAYISVKKCQVKKHEFPSKNAKKTEKTTKNQQKALKTGQKKANIAQFHPKTCQKTPPKINLNQPKSLNFSEFSVANILKSKAGECPSYQPSSDQRERVPDQ